MRFNLLLNDILKAGNPVMVRPKADDTYRSMYTRLLEGLYFLQSQGLHEISVVYIFIRSISILCGSCKHIRSDPGFGQNPSYQLPGCYAAV